VETLIVACVQQKMRLPRSQEEHKDDLRRFLRSAATKRARLVIFPELAGLMVTPALLGGFHASLLMRADQARRRRVSFWQKITGSLAGSLARSVKADFRRLLGGLLESESGAVWTAYEETYGSLAKEFDLTIVAPSAYLPDPLDGVIRNIAVVYGPGGERLGYQAKGILHPEDEDLAQPGAEWNVIQTDVGRIGLMLGGDVLYPEIGRLLAYQGAEMLIAQGAASERVLYEKLRSGMLARMQDNQLFGAISFLIGQNDFSRRQRDPFAGKSAILAPQELTPNSSGVLVESANFRSESVMAAVWDFPALANLWETSDTPVRSRLWKKPGQLWPNSISRCSSFPVWQTCPRWPRLRPPQRSVWTICPCWLRSRPAGLWNLLSPIWMARMTTTICGTREAGISCTLPTIRRMRRG
jgi:predicted amidohydrolase